MQARYRLPNTDRVYFYQENEQWHLLRFTQVLIDEEKEYKMITESSQAITNDLNPELIAYHTLAEYKFDTIYNQDGQAFKFELGKDFLNLHDYKLIKALNVFRIQKTTTTFKNSQSKTSRNFMHHDIPANIDVKNIHPELTKLSASFTNKLQLTDTWIKFKIENEIFLHSKIEDTFFPHNSTGADILRSGTNNFLKKVDIIPNKFQHPIDAWIHLINLRAKFIDVKSLRDNNISNHFREAIDSDTIGCELLYEVETEQIQQAKINYISKILASKMKHLETECNSNFEKQALETFHKIYKALYEGQSGIFKSFRNHDEKSFYEIIKYANENRDSRTAKALELTTKYINRTETSDGLNQDIFKDIYIYCFEHGAFYSRSFALSDPGFFGTFSKNKINEHKNEIEPPSNKELREDSSRRSVKIGRALRGI